MAQANLQVETTITLILTDYEANFLKSVLQNPLCEDEPQEDYELRESVWHALNELEI